MSTVLQTVGKRSKTRYHGFLWDEELTITDIGHQGTGRPTEINRPEFLNESQTDRHRKTTIRITSPGIDQRTGDAFSNRYETHRSQIMSTTDVPDLVDSLMDLGIKDG